MFFIIPDLFPTKDRERFSSGNKTLEILRDFSQIYLRFPHFITMISFVENRVLISLDSVGFFRFYKALFRTG